MQRSTIQWLLFASLFLFAPALLFMVQAIIFLPAVFIFGGLCGMLPKLLSGVNLTENLSFLGFFLFHLLIFSGLYLLISRLLAALICRLSKPSLRTAITLLMVFLFVLPAFFPVYGSGGHGPMRWTNLAGLCADFDRSYKTSVTLFVYGGSVGIGLLLFALKSWRTRLRNR